tara:strand:- start:172 stop:1515 length:1344 start_codon:yes stop_codon:yes gene_type:complete
MAVFGNILDRIANKKSKLQQSETEKRRIDEMVRANKEEAARRERESFLKPVMEQRARDAQTYSLPGVMGLAKGAEDEFRAKRQEGRAVAKEDRAKTKEFRTEASFIRAQRLADSTENLSRIKRAQLAGIPLGDVELVGGPSPQDRARLAAQAKQLTSQQVLDNKMRAAELQLRFQSTNRAKRQISEQAKVDKSTEKSWAGDPKTIITIDGSSSKTGKRGKRPGPKYDDLWKYDTPKGKRLNTGYLQSIITSEGAYATLEERHRNVTKAQEKIYGLRMSLKKAKSKEEKKELLVQISNANGELAVARNAKTRFLSVYITRAGNKAFSRGELSPQELEQQHKENASALKGMKLTNPITSDKITAQQANWALTKEANIMAKNSTRGKEIAKEKANKKKEQSAALKAFNTSEGLRLGNKIIKLDAELRELSRRFKHKLVLKFEGKGGAFVK